MKWRYTLHVSFFFFFVFCGGVLLSTLGTSATVGLLYQSRMIDDNECGIVGGKKICRENRSTRRKPAPVPLCPPKIPHDLTWDRTRAAAVGSRRLTRTYLNFDSRSWYVVSFKLRPLCPPRKESPVHCIGGCTGPRIGLEEACWKIYLCSCCESRPESPVIQPVMPDIL
jgi:hypothetical protein